MCFAKTVALDIRLYIAKVTNTATQIIGVAVLVTLAMQSTTPLHN